MRLGPGELIGFAILIAIGTPLALRWLFGTAEASRAGRLLESAARKATDITNDHMDTLARRRLATVRRDAYGVVDRSAWDAEVQYFFERVMRPTLSESERRLYSVEMARTLIGGLVAPRAAQIELQLEYDDSMTPLEYEAYCARLLERVGWTCEVTKASGDQGVDVIARKDGHILVLQVKKYSSPVGNKAVQEVVAAKAHLRAHAAAVVTQAGYTQAAYELAGSTKTLLLHHSDLLEIDALLRRQVPVV